MIESVDLVPVSVNSPLLFATVELLEPLTVMVAAGTGLPSSFMMLPLMVMVWHIERSGSKLSNKKSFGFMLF